MSVLLETSLGDIVVDLEMARVPESASNFVNLAKLKKFNNLCCCKIDKGFLAIFGEGTDPGSAQFQVQRSVAPLQFLPVERHAKIRHSKKGTVGLVNGGTHFYITLRDGPIEHLDVGEKTTIVGYVEEGLDVLEKLNTTVCDLENRPFNPIRIRHAVVLEDASVPACWMPSDLPDSPAEIIDELLGVVADEEDERVVAERKNDAIAKAQEIELELMGDLPSADSKPPPNVLFVCQLNAVTEDEDLRTVFARFGKIRKCEIIRDFKTGDSLQYAFVEFEADDSCNKAYVGMQNVLIDDRRIKVDFSQSVSRVWNQYARRGRREGQHPPVDDLRRTQPSQTGSRDRPSKDFRSNDRCRSRSRDRY